MLILNPILHMDREFMWRWYHMDDRGKPAFVAAESFFSYEECRRDYEVSVLSLKRAA